MTEGSIWRKWNFHVHTKGTNKNDQFTSSTMDDFFHLFFKSACSKQICAIGVTDYFSIDRYLDAIKYKDQIETKLDSNGVCLFNNIEIEFIKGMFIFPNVELRMLPSTDKARLINIHCLFNPEYVKDLENDFFSHINNQDGFKMNRHGLTEYGKSLSPDIQINDKQYRIGIDNFVLDPRILSELLKNNANFKKNTLLVVSNSNKDGASAIQSHYDLFEDESGSLVGLRRNLYSISDAIFSANKKDIKYFIGKRLEGKDEYNKSIYKKEVERVIEERGSLKPCIVGCDAHTESDLFRRFTWVKADLHFEGLKQMVYEPESRVKIQDSKPEFKEKRLIIDKVRFVSPKKIFTPKFIKLNPNLNVIIGGKSSGKSILLYSIARTLSADQAALKNKEGNYKYDLSRDDKDFNFEIITKAGHSQYYRRNYDDNSILPEIKYIPQNYLVKLAEPDLNKKGKSLNKIIRDLIIEDDSSKELYHAFVRMLSRNDRARDSEIDTFFETRKEIEILELELKTKPNKTVLLANIENNKIKVEELNKSIGLTDAQIKQYEELRTKIVENQSNLQHLRNDFRSISRFNSDVLLALDRLVNDKESLFESTQVDEVKDYYLTEYSELDNLYKKIEQLSQDFIMDRIDRDNVLRHESKFKELLVKVKENEKQLNNEIEPYLKNDQIKNSIQLLNSSISKDKQDLLDIDSLTKRIEDKRKSLDETKVNIFKIYEDNYYEYTSVIDLLKVRTVELEKDGLKIEGKAQFNFPKLRKELYLVSDGRTASYSQYTILDKNKKSNYETDFQDIKHELSSLFDDLLSQKYTLTSQITIRNAIKLVLNDYFFDNWVITYKNDTLREMSTGKASLVILMLIIGLSRSKAPILIDQPEDNLDNRSISTDLVNYLRNKKTERQIILVTHNANVVVNADAENIIVANQKGQNYEASSSVFKFDYVNGSVETTLDKIPNETDILKSMGIREHITEVVEGGKDAFLMREKKYGFKN